MHTPPGRGLAVEHTGYLICDLNRKIAHGGGVWSMQAAKGYSRHL